MRKLVHAYLVHPWLPLLFAFAAAVAVFAYVQPGVTLADPDSFYHAGLIEMLRDQGLVREFPWTTASLYKETFIDHHLGYHLFALPFVSLWDDPLVGLRVTTVLFAALSVLAVAFVLKRFQVPWWGVGVLLVLTAAPFVFRVSLLKAPSLAIGVAAIGYWLVAERRLGWLFLWSWFWVWFYSSWPVLIIFVGAVALAESAVDWRKGPRAFISHFFAREQMALTGAVIGGVVCGLLVNPYFPDNLVYLKQLLGMAVTPYHKLVAIGGEWYPYHPADLPAYVAYPLLAWLVSTVSAAFTLKKQTPLSRSSWLLALFFLAYTLRARRQVEYLVPWLVISSGIMLRDAGMAGMTWAKLRSQFSDWIPNWMRRGWLARAIAIYLVIIVPWGLARGVAHAKRGLDNGFTPLTLEGAAGWLMRNSGPGDVVFQSDWGTFPMLWYHNRSNYYLTGLDQTFMYEYDSERYQAWSSVVKGERRDVAKAARELFGARYVLVEKRTPAMLVWANRDHKLTRVYEDIEAIVYEIR